MKNSCSKALFWLTMLAFNGIASLAIAMLVGLGAYQLIWSNWVHIQIGPGVEEYFPEIFLWGTATNQMQLAFAQTTGWLVGITSFFFAFLGLAVVYLLVYMVLRLSKYGDSPVMKSTIRKGVRFLRYAIIIVLATAAAVLIVNDSYHDSVALLADNRPFPSLVVGTFAAGGAYLWNATIWRARQKRYIISMILAWIALDLTGFILAMIFG